MNYSNYYCNYLNIKMDSIDNNKFIFISDQRNEPICFYYYHYLIISRYYGKIIMSVAPQFQDFIRKIDSKKEFLLNENYSIDLLKSLFVNRLENFSVRKMYRMGLTNELCRQNSSINEVIQFKIEDKEIYFNTLSSIKDNSIKEQKWNLRENQIRDGRMFVIIDNNKIVSQAIVSDINFNGGNISVWTSQDYTGKGYGKSVSIEAAKWCTNNGILPIYLVDKNNRASFNIAKSIGFKTLYDEVILSSVIKN